MANHPLDDRAFVERHDPKGMYRLTVGFADQCRRALEIAQASLAQWSPITCDRVVVTGLGGSAIGGDVCRALMDAEGRVPLLVNRQYQLPAWVGPGTLVLASSYSGNTEETLSAYAQAKDRGAPIVALTSGGELLRRTGADGFPAIVIPGGQPPRTALGLMTIPAIALLVRLGALQEQDFAGLFKVLDAGIATWGVESSLETNPAKQLATALQGKLSVIYGLGDWQGVVANRWKGQINENAKNMTFANAFPELNHNEILGWVRANEQGVRQWEGIIIEDGEESAKMKERAKATIELIGPVCSFHHVTAPHGRLLSRMLGAMLMGDFVSLYLAALNEVDPENIDAINALKSRLATIPA